MAWSRTASSTSTSSTRSSWPIATCWKSSATATSNSAFRRASTSGARRCSTCSAKQAACRSRPASRASRKRAAALLDKKCKISTDEISARLIHAKKRVPFVQANLLDSRDDDPADVEAWRAHLHEHGVWANKPVPLFPYPGSPDYTRRWGAPDDRAWERAHDFYLGSFDEFSDIQEQRPAPLVQLEAMIKRILMTGDTVGGVWTYTMELAEALGAHGIHVVLAALGGAPSDAQRQEAAPHSRISSCSPATSSWSGWTIRGAMSPSPATGCSIWRSSTRRISST